jgi:hypothetical protein
MGDHFMVSPSVSFFTISSLRSLQEAPDEPESSRLSERGIRVEVVYSLVFSSVGVRQNPPVFQSEGSGVFTSVF